MNRAGNLIKRPIVWTLVFVLSLVNMQTIQAQISEGDFFNFNNEDLNLIDSGNEWAPINDGFGDIRCGVSNDAGLVYLIGDSISVFAERNLSTALSGNGWSSYIDAESGRALSATTIDDTVALESVNESRLIEAKAIVIELATNNFVNLNVSDPNGETEGTIEHFKGLIRKTIEQLKQINSEARIFWVDIGGNAEGQLEEYGAKNNVIYESSSTLNFTPIPWFRTVFGNDADPTALTGNLMDEDDLLLDEDNIHPTDAGSQELAQLVSTFVKGQESPAQDNPSGTGGVSSPLSLRYPNLINSDGVAENLTNYINQRFSSSPWLDVGGERGVGQWLFDESEERDINPLLIASVGRQENKFGTSGPAQVSSGHNYFGMKDFGQSDPRIRNNGNNDYLFFNSPEDGISYFLDVVQRNTTGTGSELYLEVTNFYEYLGMHQTGTIVYPGEPLGDKGPNGQDGFDPTMQVYISWTTSDHPNDRYDGQLFNPGIYYTNSINFINELTGLTLSDNPVRGSNGAADCVGPRGIRGNIDPEGYSFPLAPQTQAVSGISIGQTETTHHDNTPAFDLFSSDSAAVYAIYDGTIDTINYSYKKQAGCHTVQFYADDGFYYWYGHLKNADKYVVEGQHVAAGTQIAEIADDRNFNSTCWGGTPHLHIDKGCSLLIGGNLVPQRAGRDECRDPDFIPFLSTIYENLPPG